MHEIERAVLGIHTGKVIVYNSNASFTPKLDKLALGILGLERIGTQCVPKSFFSNLAVPTSNPGTVKEPWKGFFRPF